MDNTVKKAETKSNKPVKNKPSVGVTIKSFWKGVKKEFSKIIWPSKDVLKKQTIAVLAISVVLSAFIKVFDIACQYVVNFIR